MAIHYLPAGRQVGYSLFNISNSENTIKQVSTLPGY